MSLDLTPEPSRYVSSATFNEAVNDVQFVRTFGIISLVGSVLVFVSGAIAIGLGLAVVGFGHRRYFKLLGGSVIALGAGSLVLGPLGVVASLVLASGVAWMALQVHRVLRSEGQGDPDWDITNKRATIGLVTSALGVGISLLWLVLIVVGLLAALTGV